MDREQFIKMMSGSKMYDLTQGCSIFTPPWPGEKSLEIHFFKRVTGAYGGGQGANGQILDWSNTVGTHLVGETAFNSGGRRICDIPLTDLCGQGVIADISDLVSDYSLYTPEMILKKVDVKKGDILIINTGYHKYSWDQPDVVNPNAQGGVESKEFGFLVRHPGPSPEFFKWALEMQLKVVGVDCGCAEHPMNTPIRRMHENHFILAEEKLVKEHGKKWDEMFPQDEYYQLTHITMPKSHLLLAECIVGDIDKLKNKRAWIMIMPIPYMEVETAWSRVVAHTAPEGISEEDFFKSMENSEVVELRAAVSRLQQTCWRAVFRHGPQRFHLSRQHPPGHAHGRRETLLPERARHRPGSPGRLGRPGRHRGYLRQGQQLQRLHPQDDHGFRGHPQG
jgi:arylformamidase